MPAVDDPVAYRVDPIAHKAQQPAHRLLVGRQRSVLLSAVALPFSEPDGCAASDIGNRSDTELFQNRRPGLTSRRLKQGALDRRTPAI
jgi:hypothetical protein